MSSFVLTYDRSAAYWAGRVCERLSSHVDSDVRTLHPFEAPAFGEDDRGLVALAVAGSGDLASEMQLAISIARRASVPVVVADLARAPDDTAPSMGWLDGDSGVSRVRLDVEDLDAGIDQIADALTGGDVRSTPYARPGVATVAAFVGVPARYPRDQPMTAPRRVSSWNEYALLFGEYEAGSTLPYAVAAWFANGGGDCFVVPVEPLHPGAEDLTAALGQLGSLDRVAVFAVPDLERFCSVRDDGGTRLDLGSWQRIQIAAIASAERDRRMVLLDPPPGLSAYQAQQWRLDAGYDSAFAALYHPWLPVPDRVQPGRTLMVPPCGHVAGAWAASDRAHGMAVSPANTRLSGISDDAGPMTSTERFMLHSVGVNMLRRVGPLDVRLWGSRTLSPEPSMSRLEDVRLALATGWGGEAEAEAADG